VDVIAGRARDSIAAESGRFAAHLALPPGGVDLRITPDTSVLHAALVRAPMGREVQDVTIALIPKTWRIDAGTHAGREIALDATQALRRASGSAGGFWRVAPGVPGLLIGWRDADFPLRIAFDRRRGVQADDADSIAFWRAAEEMQRDLGSTFFQPATLVGDARPAGVVVVDFNDGLAEGHTFVTWSRDGTIYEGTLTFRRPASVRDAGVVTHELLHLLGFGHGTGWPTISRATRDARVRLTPEDVAYVQVALRLRTLGQRHRARPGLPAPPN
jgi:hypothetical protein